MHLGIPAVSLPRGAAAAQMGQRSHDNQRADPCFCWMLQVLCSWLQQGQAEVVHQGKVWKTQLRRGQHGKEELEGKDRL